MEKISEIKIDRKDVIWNYLATFLQIGSGVLLFPVILKMLPTQTLGIWSIFVAITGLINLLDFGFSPSFTRNITYIYSGVDVLKATGISTEKLNSKVNYDLLANTIQAMKWFYSRMALLAFILLISAGSFYLFHVLKTNFHDDKTQIYIAWIFFCLINTYNIYTLYYDSLILGFGLVMKSKQFIIVGQLAYLFVSVVLIINGFGLISIVAGQAISVIIRRLLSNRFFFTPDLKIKLEQIKTDKFRDIVKVITPNSIKVGLTHLGAFLVLQSSVIIGSLYISLEKLASYGITVQVVNVISSLASVYYLSYLPKVANLRVENNLSEIIKIYYKCIRYMIMTFFVCGIALIIFGNWGLTLLKSQTFLLSNIMIFIVLLISFLEKNHAVAAGFLLTKNEVPYFKAAIISGIATVIMLLILIKIANLEVWGMVLAPGIVQIAYQNWKWPIVLMKQLNLKD